MTAEEWNRNAGESAVKHFRHFCGREPESTEHALEWQKQFITAIIAADEARKLARLGKQSADSAGLIEVKA